VLPRANGQIVHEPIGQALGAARRADVQIAIAVGQLRLGALEQSGELVAGTIGYPERNHVTRSFAIDGDTATFTLREQDSQAGSLIKYKNDEALWDLRLNPATPVRLELQAGVGESTIDLSQLQVTELTLTTDVGKTTLTLPRRGQLQAHVIGNVSETTIHVPAGVAVRFRSGTGLGHISVPKEYQRQGDVYSSPDYETAANRVDLDVHSDIGEIAIVQD
jgi:hypothetical protein